MARGSDWWGGGVAGGEGVWLVVRGRDWWRGGVIGGE